MMKRINVLYSKINLFASGMSVNQQNETDQKNDLKESQHIQSSKPINNQPDGTNDLSQMIQEMIPGLSNEQLAQLKGLTQVKTPITAIPTNQPQDSTSQSNKPQPIYIPIQPIIYTPVYYPIYYYYNPQMYYYQQYMQQYQQMQLRKEDK